MKIARINERGMRQIAEELRVHHKLGDFMTPSMLSAWASAAEDNYAASNGCVVEIRVMHSLSGAPVVIEIGDDGYDVEEIDS